MATYQLTNRNRLVTVDGNPVEVEAEKPSDAQAWFREHWEDYKKNSAAYGIRVKGYHPSKAFVFSDTVSEYELPTCII